MCARPHVRDNHTRSFRRSSRSCLHTDDETVSHMSCKCTASCQEPHTFHQIYIPATNKYIMFITTTERTVRCLKLVLYIYKKCWVCKMTSEARMWCSGVVPSSGVAGTLPVVVTAASCVFSTVWNDVFLWKATDSSPKNHLYLDCLVHEAFFRCGADSRKSVIVLAW